MTTRFNTIAALALTCAMILATPSVAQENEGPEWWSVTFVQVKPDMDTEFQDLLKNHWLPAVRKTDIPLLATWRTAQFGDAFEYFFASPIPNLAMYDGEPPLLKVMKADEYAMFYERLRDCVTSVRSIAMVAEPDASFDKSPAERPQMAVHSIAVVKPGKGGEYRALLKKLIPHLEETDHRAMWSYQTVFGGESNEWRHLLLLDSFAHLDKGPPLVRAVGPEEAAKIEARLSGLVESRRMSIVILLPEFTHVKQ